MGERKTTHIYQQNLYQIYKLCSKPIRIHKYLIKFRILFIKPDIRIF